MALTIASALILVACGPEVSPTADLPVNDDSSTAEEPIDTAEVVQDSLEELLASTDANNDNISIRWDEDYIYLTSNSLPNHETGDFPNAGNPNSISAIDVEYKITRSPKYENSSTASKIFGVTLNGVSFDPGTAEKDSTTGWSIEGFQDLMDLGLDFNNAHVQPSGKYHYHGIPESDVDGDTASQHSSLVAFAADGHPVYVRYGFSDTADLSSAIIQHTSSWQLKEGERGDGEPSGSYDGTYTNDFEYVEGSGTLDNCNGINTVTPDYPEGTYSYFLTDEFPYVPRCHHGSADSSFDQGDPRGGGPGMSGGPGPGGQLPPPPGGRR
jgi:hypothetical protein